MKQLAPFSTLEQSARKMIADAETIALLPPTDANAKVARAMRLEIKPLRIAVEKRHAELKRPILDAGNALDDGKNALLDLLKPMESKLLAIEQHAEREALRIEDEKRATRHAEISPFLTGPLSVDLGKMPDDEYAKVLADAKDLAQLREERARKEKEAAEAQAKAEAEERERIAAENSKLKKEAEEREAKALAEREEAAKLAREEKAKADAEIARAKAESDAREKAAAEKARKELEAANQKAAEEARIAAAKARKERDEIEAKAKAEKAAAEKKAKAEREAREKLEAEIAAKQAAESKAEAERLAAEKAAAMAPEKEKLKALAKTVIELNIPDMTSEEGLAAATEIHAQVVKFAAYIAKKAESL